MYELIEAFRMNIPSASNYDPWSRSLVCFVVCTGTTVKVDTVDLSSLSFSYHILHFYMDKVPRLELSAEVEASYGCRTDIAFGTDFMAHNT